jgi:hypothetical protein
MSNLATLKPFKKGFDPNRNLQGRKVGSRNLITLMRETLQKVNEDGIPYDDLLVKKVFDMAIKDGNENMIKMIFEHQQKIVEASQKDTVATRDQITVSEKTMRYVYESENGSDTE